MLIKPSTGGQKPEKRTNMLHDIGLRIIKILNLGLIGIPFTICWIYYNVNQVGFKVLSTRSISVILMFEVLYFFFGRVYDAFLISIKRVIEILYSQILGIIMADGFMFLVLCLLSKGMPNLLPALLALGGQILLSALWCLAANRWYFSRFAGKKTGIIYDVRRDAEQLFKQYGHDTKFDVQFVCSVKECFAEGMSRLKDVEAVFLFGVHSHDRNIILKHCISKGIVVYVIPRVGDVIMSGAKRMHMFHLPMLRVERYNPTIEYQIVKRTFDIVSSLLMIIVTSPIMLAVAIAIKVCDGGPVLYKQTRLTKDGKRFRVWKFRSMRIDAEKDGIARLSTGENDDRITPVGKVIRACRLDELPQLFNILGGSMSVVGPRPERPEIVARYEKEMPEFALRLQAKAGLTGYAQVYGKYNTEPYDKLQMDLMYISKPSFVEDLRIVFATVRILFDKESTEGVTSRQVTALDREDHAEPVQFDEAVGK